MNKLATLIDEMSIDDAKNLLRDVQTQNIERLLELKIHGKSNIEKPCE